MLCFVFVKWRKNSFSPYKSPVVKKWFGAGLPGDTVLVDVFGDFASG